MPHTMPDLARMPMRDIEALHEVARERLAAIERERSLAEARARRR